jgi:sensor histidine kinase YesM
MSVPRATVHLDRIVPRDPRLRGAIVLILLVFAATLLIFTVAAALRGDITPSQIYAIGLPMVVGDGLLAFQLVFVLAKAERLRAMWRWSVVAVAVILVALAQSVWDTQLRIWERVAILEYRSAYLAFIRALTLNLYHTAFVAALLAFQAANLKLREKQRELVASRASERDAHLVALRFQLNPHFLFNTMNALSSLVMIGRTAHAEAMIDRLSAFLRATLNADPRSLVRVDEEFDMIESYLEIESVRFGERLETRIDLPLDLSGVRIPPFLLQPIVENAIKYAVAPSTRAVLVRIAAEMRDGEMILSVTDDGDGIGEVSPGTGVGLANVRERLRLKYGDSARLEKRQDGNGCRVEIAIPLYGDDQLVPTIRPAVAA